MNTYCVAYPVSHWITPVLRLGFEARNDLSTGSALPWSFSLSGKIAEGAALSRTG